MGRATLLVSPSLSLSLLPFLFVSAVLFSLPQSTSALNGTMRLTAITLAATFPIRQEAGVAIYPSTFSFYSASSQRSLTWQAGFIVLYGGERSAAPLASEQSLNDVWVTSDALTWELISGTANGVTATSSRTMVDFARTADCQDSDGGLYLISGSTRNATIHAANVSYSANLVDWDFYPNQAFWRRQRSSCTVTGDKTVYLMGGLTHVNNANAATASNDVWKTNSRGANGGWTLVTMRAMWPARQGLNIESYYSTYLNTEIMYVMNGYSGAPRWNDIWISTDQGNNFVRLNPYAEYPGRMDSQVSFTKAGTMIISSGDCGGSCNANDVWASMDRGYTWGQCCDGPLCGFTKREDHVQVLDQQSRVLIISGSQQNPSGPHTNDVWRSNSLQFDNTGDVARYCNLKVPAGGIGLRCIPGGFCLNPPQGYQGIKMQHQGMAPWAPRFEGGIAIYPKQLIFTDINTNSRRTLAAGAIITYGGRPSYDNKAPSYNDVWATVDGKTWYLIGGYDGVTGQASARTDAMMVDQGRTADCYDSNGKIYMVAGTTLDDVKSNSVWSSVDAGMTWVEVGNAPFVPREAAACAVDSKGVLYVVSGSINDNDVIENYLNDVWMSSNGGKDWKQRTLSAPFSRRGQADMDVLKTTAFGGTDVLYFGNGYGLKPGSANRLNDIWVSANGGQAWQMVTANAPYYGRQDSQLLITNSGALVVVAGDTGINSPGNTNDIWASLDGGYTWALCNMTAGFTPREDHVTTFDKSGYLWVMQGEAPFTPMLNDVWRSTVTFSDANIVTYCKAKIPSCGVGLKCLPNTKSCVNHCPPYDPDNPDNNDPDDPYASTASNGGGSSVTSSSELSAGYIVLIVAAILVVGTGGFLLWRRASAAQKGAQGMGGELSTGLTGHTSDMTGSATEQYHQLEHGTGQQQL